METNSVDQEPVSMDVYLDFGLRLQSLRQAETLPGLFLISYLSTIQERLEQFGFHFSADVAKPLKVFQERLQNAEENAPTKFRDGIPKEWADELRPLVEPLLRAILSEAKNVVLVRTSPTRLVA
jgi:hypothetical protein